MCPTLDAYEVSSAAVALEIRLSISANTHHAFTFIKIVVVSCKMDYQDKTKHHKAIGQVAKPLYEPHLVKACLNLD